MKKINKLEGQKKKMLVSSLKWGFIFLIISLIIFFLIGPIALKSIPIFLVLGMVYGFLIKRFEKYKLWVRPLSWTFIMISSSLWLIIPDFSKPLEYFMDRNVGTARIVLSIVVFAIFFIAPFVLNFIFNILSNYLKKKLDKYSLIISLIIFILKLIILGFIWSILIILLMISRGGSFI